MLHLATQAQQLHQNARMKKIIDFDQQHYFAQNQKGKWGFCLAGGRAVVAMQYDTLLALDRIHFNPKDYSMQYTHTNYLIGKKGAEQLLLNLKGETLLKANGIMPRLMGDVVLVRIGTSWGLAKTDGKFLLSASCSEIEWYNDVLALKYEGKWKLFNPQHKNQTLTTSYNTVQEVVNNTRYNQKETFLLVQQDDKWGVLNENLKPIIPIEKEQLKPIVTVNKYSKKKTQFLVKEKKLWGVVDIDNKSILEVAYAQIDLVQWSRTTLNIAQQPLFVVTKNGKRGILNQEGTVVLPINYDAIDFKKEHFDGVFEIKKENTTSQVQWDGYQIVEMSMKP